MKRPLEEYNTIVGDEVIVSIYEKAKNLYGKHILNINSTYDGGGVAELLSSIVPILNYIGLDVGWRILHGNPEFFTITKKFHNTLQGNKVDLTDLRQNIYEDTNEKFSYFTHLDKHDIIMIHDPQPLPLIKFYNKRQPWIWRCHIDLSNPNRQLWDYMKRYLLRYDKIVYSDTSYIQQDLPVSNKVIRPAIDPMDAKNKSLSEAQYQEFLEKAGIPTDKPFITQVSRFDKWKDPEGVIDVYKKVKQKADCRLIMVGSQASDDPEGSKVFKSVLKKVEEEIDDHEDNVIFITSQNNILVNTIQKKAAVVIQKSLREGFGLTVTESLWKGTPVVGSNIGGIKLQIEDGKNGYLLSPNDYDGFANKIIHLLKNPKENKLMGENGRMQVKNKFLITRLIQDYLDLFTDILN